MAIASPARESLKGTAEPIEFTVDGDVIRGTKFVPAGFDGPLPAVVMGHGWSMVAQGGDLAEYAAVIANRGHVVITFDFRNLGASDGLPRQEIDPYRQIEDFRCAITFARAQPEVDPSRIGIWGSSYSGGHVLVVAAIDKRVTCVVSQVPTISGYQAGLRRAPHVQAKLVRQALEADREARFHGQPAGTIQTVSADLTANVAYPQQDSYDYMSSEGERCPTWRNEVTLRSLELARMYEPGAYIARISPTPLLMIVASDDGQTPTDLQLTAFNQALEPKRLELLDGGHYTAYTSHFDRSSGAAADWFTQHLAAK